MSEPDLKDLPEICLGSSARLAARSMMRVYALHMGDLDLNFPQFGLLVALAQLPGRNVREIADRVGLDASTLTRSIALLERRGAVTGDGGRGRAGKLLRLTPAGEALLQQALKAWGAAQAELVAELGEAEADETRRSLARMRNAALRVAEKMDL